MKSLLLFLFILFFVDNTNAQSILYNEKHQLRADTTFTISETQYKAWRYSEGNVIAGLSTIKFPPVYSENNIPANKILIASFVCDSNEVRDIEVINGSDV